MDKILTKEEIAEQNITNFSRIFLSEKKQEIFDAMEQYAQQFERPELTKEEIEKKSADLFPLPLPKEFMVDRMGIYAARKHFTEGVEWAVSQFERPDNDSGQGWISVEENWLEDEIKKCDKDITLNEEHGYTWSRLESVGRKKMLTEILNKK